MDAGLETRLFEDLHLFMLKAGRSEYMMNEDSEREISYVKARIIGISNEDARLLVQEVSNVHIDVLIQLIQYDIMISAEPVLCEVEYGVAVFAGNDEGTSRKAGLFRLSTIREHLHIFAGGRIEC